MIRREEVDDEIDQKERVDDGSNYCPRNVVLIGECESPWRRDAHEENEDRDEDVPECLERVFRENDERL